jgi:hypothetical protein
MNHPLSLPPHAMAPRRLLNDYRAARLERVALGPRRELILFVVLNPAFNLTILQDAVVRFGSIANFAEVEAFFSSLPVDAASDHLALIRRLEPETHGVCLLELEGYGALRILSDRCLERKR